MRSIIGYQSETIMKFEQPTCFLDVVGVTNLFLCAKEYWENVYYS